MSAHLGKTCSVCSLRQPRTTMLQSLTAVSLPVVAWAAEEGVDDDTIREKLEDLSDDFMARKAVEFGPENMRMIEKQILLESIDFARILL